MSYYIRWIDYKKIDKMRYKIYYNNIQFTLTYSIKISAIYFTYLFYFYFSHKIEDRIYKYLVLIFILFEK